MEAVVLGDGEGEVFGAAQSRLRFLAQSPDHPVVITDNTVPPGFPGSVRHRYARMTDIFSVLVGELAQELDGERPVLGSGGFGLTGHDVAPEGRGASEEAVRPEAKAERGGVASLAGSTRERPRCDA